MKIRHAFVSNSSTTNFCILGSVFPSDVADELSSESGLDCHRLYQEGDESAVGISLEKIATWREGNGTYNEFVKEVKKRLETVGLKPDDIHVMEGGWYDG